MKTKNEQDWEHGKLPTETGVGHKAFERYPRCIPTLSLPLGRRGVAQEKREGTHTAKAAPDCPLAARQTQPASEKNE